MEKIKYPLKTTISIVLILLVSLSFLNAYLYFDSRHSAEFHERKINHTHNLILLSTHLLSYIKDTETGQRGFLLTQDEVYLKPYYKGVELSTAILDKLRQLTYDNMDQQIRLSRLDGLLNKKMEELELTINQAKDGKLNISIAIVNSDLGHTLMNDIRNIVTSFVEEENRLLELHMKSYQSSKDANQLKLMIGLALLIFTTLYAAFRLRKRFIQPVIELTESTETFSQHKDTPIRAKTYDNEIGILANTFTEMSQEIIDTIGELKLAKQKSEETSIAKSRFLFNISHEVRSPLNGIYGILQLIQRGKYSSNSEFLDQLDKALFSCKTLETIINDIIDYSKLESGNLVVDSSTFSITKVVNMTLSQMKPHAKDKGLKLEVDIEKGLNEYWQGDSIRLKQILMNLLSNSIKFTQIGKIRLSLHTDENENLIIHVRDTGIGMSVNERKRIIESFKRAEPSIIRQLGESGLGMAITFALVDLMGGDLKVNSEVDEGTEFIVTLPLKKSLPIDASPDAEEGGALPNWLGLKVAVIEDSEVNLLICRGMLEKTGCEVIEAQNGKDGVDLVIREKPDLVLMDIHMPVMDGIQAHRLIKDHNENLPVIALTASVMYSDTKKYREEGFQSCIAKPIEMFDLYREAGIFLNRIATR